MRDKKAQGSMEYLIMTAAILAIASVVILFSTGFFSGQQGTASFNACRQAAGVCKISKLSSPNDPCTKCEESCAGITGTSTGKDLMSNEEGCGAACKLCKSGFSNRISLNYSPGEITPDSSAVLLWHFNEGSGIAAIDSSGRGYNGTIGGSAAWIYPAMFNYGIDFDGTNDQVNTSVSIPGLIGDLTIELWIKGENIGTNRLNPIDKWPWGEFALTIEPAGSLTYYHGPGICCSTVTFAAFPAGTLQNGNWYHIAVTRDNTNKMLYSYLNGVPKNSLSYAGGISPNSTTQKVMVGKGYTGFGFDGIIDEVVISNRAKPSWEIWADANA